MRHQVSILQSKYIPFYEDPQLLEKSTNTWLWYWYRTEGLAITTPARYGEKTLIWTHNTRAPLYHSLGNWIYTLDTKPSIDFLIVYSNSSKSCHSSLSHLKHSLFCCRYRIILYLRCRLDIWNPWIRFQNTPNSIRIWCFYLRTHPSICIVYIHCRTVYDFHSKTFTQLIEGSLWRLRSPGWRRDYNGDKTRCWEIDEILVHDNDCNGLIPPTPVRDRCQYIFG